MPLIADELSFYDSETSSLEAPGGVAVALRPHQMVAEIALDQRLHIPDIPAILSHQRKLLARLLECFPAIAAALIISSLVWGPLLAPLPFTIAILCFHVYWLWRAFMNGIHAVKGFWLLRRPQVIDCRATFQERPAPAPHPLPL